MNTLVQLTKNRQIITTSKRIAEVFGKEHKNVIKAINKLVGDMNDAKDLGGLTFEPTSYVDTQGRDKKQYIMNRDGFTLLAMGFTGPKALKFKLQYIQAFNEMEAKLRAQDVQKKVEALMSARWVDSRVKPENDRKNNVPENDVTFNGVGVLQNSWEVSDADLIRVLHNWHATKNKKETEEFRRLHAENDELRGRLNRISQALE
ncbi:MAG: Rha family transcriptional regulator [Alphaproteobacteria bacterium]|nr:Rha family transcriptional regulator [Alphaproteobacteria bacterium]